MLRELISLFLRLGITGFGGPAVHIAMMEDEVVARRGWMSRQYFLDLVGATNLIPGPNSTEMTMHVGQYRAGFPGLVVAGASFILPAVAITGVLAWLYVRAGTLPEAGALLDGIRPAVIAVILVAIWRLGRKAARNWQLLVIGLAVAAAAFLGFGEVQALLLGGVMGMIWLRGRAGLDDRAGLARALAITLALLAVVSLLLAFTLQSQTLWQSLRSIGGATASLGQLGVYFLVIGSVLYGSGYVLFAFLQGGLVATFGWLTQQQLIDAIAIGQLTPGPLLSTATFIGYVIAGWPGAIVATLGIFLAFLFPGLCPDTLDAAPAALPLDGGFPGCRQYQRCWPDGGGFDPTGQRYAGHLASGRHRPDGGGAGLTLAAFLGLACGGRRPCRPAAAPVLVTSAHWLTP